MSTVNKQILLIAVLLLSCFFSYSQHHAKPQNVILIIADDIGYGDLSCYGARAVRTPHIDQVAKRGLVFSDAHTTASTCTPSRYSIFTGEYNWRKKGTGIATGDAGMVIRPEQFTMADMFQQAGYTTGAIGKWHLGLGDKQGDQDWNGLITPGPVDIGFDYSFLMAATGDRVPCVWVENQRVVNYDAAAPISVSYKNPFPGEPLGKDHPELLTKLKPSPNHGHNQAIVNGISRIGYMKGGGKALWQDEYIADTIASRATSFIKQHKKEQFFLYVGTNDIHVPRYPHPRFAGKSGMGFRGDAILQFDWTVGEIVKALKENGLFDNTLIVISSDNGPVIDDGYQDEAEALLGNHKPWGPLHTRSGKYSNFEAGTRVPFIVSWPARVKNGTSAALISQVDLLASFAVLVGQQSIPAQVTDSQDQLKALLGTGNTGRQYIIESSTSLSVSDGEWKYIVPNTSPAFYELTQTRSGNAPVDQLYHLKTDLAETRNLANDKPEKVAALKALLLKEKEKGYMRDR
ncbi:sulfatase family protein [Niabella sp. CJ426]|uniref:sulfatase family protein n=1 Tax=Niabella sp. CJ426 TaxID=3393740 RepID=UPI003CFF7EC5